jgi:hypothetical protein
VFVRGLQATEASGVMSEEVEREVPWPYHGLHADTVLAADGTELYRSDALLIGEGDVFSFRLPKVTVG